MIDIEELKRKALAEASRPWGTLEDWAHVCPGRTSGELGFMVAAAPPAILALIERLEAAEADIRRGVEATFKMRAQLESAERDAARYRWLREPSHFVVWVQNGDCDEPMLGVQLDAGVDHGLALAKGKA